MAAVVYLVRILWTRTLCERLSMSISIHVFVLHDYMSAEKLKRSIQQVALHYQQLSSLLYNLATIVSTHQWPQWSPPESSVLLRSWSSYGKPRCPLDSPEYSAAIATSCLFLWSQGV